MKFNDNVDDEIEFDDMKIKSHLDTSLDLSGISVSEDLINRTLEAIKKQSIEQPEDQVTKTASDNGNKRIVAWNKYIRSFAGIAAAAILVVAGMNVLSNGAKNSKDMSYNAETTASKDAGDYATNSSQEAVEENSTMVATEADDSTAKMEGSTNDTSTEDKANITYDAAETEAATQFSITAGFTMENDTAVYGSEGEEETLDIASTSLAIGNSASGASVNGSEGEASIEPAAQEEQPVANKGAVDNTILNFRNIFLSEPENAEYITITDEINGSAITITDQADIKEFYNVMDKHEFTYGAAENSVQNYTIEISDPEIDAIYVMTIGNYITVSFTDREVSSQSVYDVMDKSLLSQDLREFIANYRE